MESGCQSVTYQPSTLNCWLKNQRFGERLNVLAGYNSMNLVCEGEVFFQGGQILQKIVEKLLFAQAQSNMPLMNGL